MADIFDVIADSTRRDLLHLLLERGLATAGEGDAAAGEISVGDIVERLELSQPTVSKHLRVLREHGLVTVREEGQHRYYRLEASPLEEVDDWLAPFLGTNFDSDRLGDTEGTAAFAAWAGADVGDTIGRKVADSTHHARTVLTDATEKVTSSLPKIFTRRPFRKR